MQEYYYTLVVRPSSHYELFHDFLSDTTPVGFEENDNTFIIRSEDELETIAWAIQQFAEALQKALGESVDVELELSKDKNADWVKSYQDAIAPIEIEQFYIHPTFHEPKAERVNIAIDPALAFGTGHHPTTASCLRAISKFVQRDDKVIDIGSGSGILSIASAKLHANVDACDTDEISVKNTLENAQINSVKLNACWEGSAAQSSELYDVVIANIVADVLVFIASDIKKLLKKEGVIILSGILDKYEDKVLKSYKEFDLLERIVQDEWRTLILNKKDS